MDIETLLKNPEELKRLLSFNDSIIKQYQQELESKNIELEYKNKIINKQSIEIQRQENKIQILQQVIFARKTEKVIRESPKQNLLFNEAETYLNKSDVETKEVKSYKRKNAGRKPIPNNIPREEVINDLSAEEKICSCGCTMKKIGNDIKEEIEYIPAKVYVRKTITPKYICKSCSRKKPNVEIKKANPINIPLIEKSIVTPSLLASILYQKFFLALPFYRQSKMFEHMGIRISRTDMCNWTITIYEKYLQDFINLFWKEIKSSPHIHIDETRLRVLNQKNKDRTNSFMWIIASKTCVLYMYQETRGTEFLRDYLKDFKGSITTDGYESYTHLLKTLPDITQSGCMAHARRKFLENKVGFKSSQTARTIIQLIRKLYRVERWIKEIGLNNDDILKLRKKYSTNYLSKIKVILDENLPNVSSGTYIGNAISYLNNQWSKLIQFTNNPNIPIDNNFVENLIRPFVVGRKNWLFSASEDGAHASAMYYSLMVSAGMNGLNPTEYIKTLLEKLPTSSSDEERIKLLPWNFNRA